MATLFYSHPDFLKHDTGAGHPENSRRLTAIDQALQNKNFKRLIRLPAPLADDVNDKIKLIHPETYIDNILAMVPAQGFNYIDADTILSPGSANAALRAVSSVCDGLDRILQNQANQAFCSVRPPGHHATPTRAMGFCLFNNIAIGAEYARRKYQVEHIAIVDFDVHHGNGTQAAFEQQTAVLYASSHEMPNYPGTGYVSETGVGNIVNVPLHAGCTGAEFRRLYQTRIFPELEKFKPELLLISAGFDAHRDDPLSSIQLLEDDYFWVTQELTSLAERFCQGKLLSVLEGGYNLVALGNSVAQHILALLQADS